jgi:hypothetical protein
MLVKTNAPNPAQPNTATYDVSSLYLFPSVLRTPDDPPFDPNFPLGVKNWVDPTLKGSPDDTVTYSVLSGMNIVPLTMTVAQAQRRNPAGAFNFPPYAPAPTPAMNNQNASPLSPTMIQLLSSLEDALSFSAQHGLQFEGDETPDLPGVTWNGEMRRGYTVLIGGQDYYVGDLIAQQNRKGIGYPGTWDFNADGGPKWTPAPEPDFGTIPVCQTPLRALLQGETITTGMLGMGIVVRRGDVAQPGASSGSGSGGGLTQEEHDRLMRNGAILDKLGVLVNFKG